MFAAVASDEIDIFHVILHDNIIMWFSIIKKLLKNWYLLLSSMKTREYPQNNYPL